LDRNDAGWRLALDWTAGAVAIESIEGAMASPGCTPR
jgi:hypothetical protein